MKKRTRPIPIQFFVNKTEEKNILRNMESNGMTNISDFMRLVSQHAKIAFRVSVSPKMLHVSEAQLGTTGEEKGSKRAVG